MPRGPARDLRNLLYTYYRQAGSPSLDELATLVRVSDDVPGAPGRDSIHRIITGRVVPTKEDAVTLAMVLARMAEAGVAEAVHTVENLWRTLDRGPDARIGQPIRDCDPALLGVHPVIESDGGTGLPPYVARDHDDQLLEIVTCWPLYWAELTTRPLAEEPDVYAPVRQLLVGAERVAVADHFAPDAREWALTSVDPHRARRLPGVPAATLDRLDRAAEAASHSGPANLTERFSLYLQPIVDLRTGEVTSLEALLRVRDDLGVPRSPSTMLATSVPGTRRSATYGSSRPT
jgi:hypothetical protein